MVNEIVLGIFNIELLIHVALTVWCPKLKPVALVVQGSRNHLCIWWRKHSAGTGAWPPGGIVYCSRQCVCACNGRKKKFLTWTKSQVFRFQSR